MSQNGQTRFKNLAAFARFLEVFKLFFHKASQKEAGTRFVLLSQSKNMIERSIKTYLQRPIEIFPFLLAIDFEDFKHNFKIFLQILS